MNRVIKTTLAGLAAAALTTAASVAPAAGGTLDSLLGGLLGSGGTAVGLTDHGHLVSFKLRAPESPKTIGAVHGLKGDKKLIGIDYRVQNGKLYGVGSSGGIYTVSTSSAKATKVSQLTVTLQGSKFGVDFNPAADRLRVISDSGQNLRHDVNPGGATIADGTLTLPPDPAAAAGVTAAAYTNNDLDPDTATTLFDLDTTRDQVVLQSPANSGQLSPTGKLGVDAGSDAGFDIYSELSRGSTQAVAGWATLKVDGRYGLYSINLLTGAADREGRFPSRHQVTDLAVTLDR
ncbi:DUF4394 domain-containing protein [Microlunatus speluncae]|uniref:DUF4394 domain-containing protein n=1 Tax=Microlunatus speluncae TaxID=2594267 RepID=UPI00126632B6|nr:DUF4394 domain-containing protein [Microlunatus speluncae]